MLESDNELALVDKLNVNEQKKELVKELLDTIRGCVLPIASESGTVHASFSGVLTSPSATITRRFFGATPSTSKSCPWLPEDDEHDFEGCTQESSIASLHV